MCPVSHNENKIEQMMSKLKVMFDYYNFSGLVFLFLFLFIKKSLDNADFSMSIQKITTALRPKLNLVCFLTTVHSTLHNGLEFFSEAQIINTNIDKISCPLWGF